MTKRGNFALTQAPKASFTTSSAVLLFAIIASVALWLFPGFGADIPFLGALNCYREAAVNKYFAV
jgi:hypothetical protein